MRVPSRLHMRTDADGRRALYPVMLDLAGRDVLVVGGGRVAAQRMAALLAAGACVRVVAPALDPELRIRHEAGEVQWEARPADVEDVGNASLVLCAAGDVGVNAAVATAARERGIPVAVADDPQAGTFVVPASLRRGALVVAVATCGGSPALAGFVRRQLETVVGEEYALLTELAARMRQRARAAGVPAAERERVATDAFPRLLGLLRDGDVEQARALADELAIPAGAA